MSDALSLPDRLRVRSGSRGAPRRHSPIGRSLVGWILPLAALAIWQAGASLGFISSSVLPSPTDVVKAAYRSTLDGELLRNMAVSTGRAAAGFLVGSAIGLVFGVANGLSRIAEATTDTTLQMARNVPHLALIPLVILWFGIDEGAKLFLISLGVFFPVYINTLHGIRSVDPQLIEMAQSYGLRRTQLFRRIILPGALASILVGFRYALGITWLTLIVAETVAAQSGIGFMAMQAREFMQTDIVVLAILIYALLGKLADSSIRLVERRALAWNPAYSTGERS